MATTKIWDIQTKLDRVLDYVMDKIKTDEANYYDLHRVAEYVKASYKTEEQLYVTGINCTEDNAYEEMVQIKQAFNKEDGVLGYHAIQSFAEGEVTPELAHKIGVQLAEELWGDRFQVIVTTHLNTNHIHNHFLLNSVSFVDGKKYYDNDKTYALMRYTSDCICRENKLSVLKEKVCGKFNIDYTKYLKTYNKKSNYHNTTKKDIDFAIAQADTYKEFENLLKRMDYELIYRAGVLSVRHSPYTRNIRVARAFGEDYTMEKIKERIRKERAVKVPFPEARNKKFYAKRSIIKNKKKATGLKALYLYYCYLLRIFPKTSIKKKAPLKISADVQKLRRISEEAKLLSRMDIKTTGELSLYIKTLKQEQENLEEKRDKLYYQNTKLKKEERQVNYEELSQIAGKLQMIKKELQMCDEILKRTPKIKENIKEIEEKNNNKERSEKTNEYIK